MQQPDTPEETTLPSPHVRRKILWSAHRRRPAFLLLLLVGLAMAFAWAPADTRASLWRALNVHRELTALGFLFALLTLSLVWAAGERWDSRLFRLFNQRTYPKWLDNYMWLFTQLGNMLTAFLVAFIFFLRGYRYLGVEIVLATILLWLLVETIKALAIRDRPFLTLEDTRVIGWREKGDSFPSGHTSQIFFLVTLLTLRFTPGLGISLALYTIAAIVGFTRIYVGAHYPRDVLGGAVLGSIWGILAMLVSPR
jgi:membrane-associated phospholipid phosphatase